MFFNIQSDDFSRVVLKQLENREGADYINASFINVRNSLYMSKALPKKFSSVSETLAK